MEASREYECSTNGRDFVWKRDLMMAVFLEAEKKDLCKRVILVTGREFDERQCGCGSKRATAFQLTSGLYEEKGLYAANRCFRNPGPRMSMRGEAQTGSQFDRYVTSGMPSGHVRGSSWRKSRLVWIGWTHGGESMLSMIRITTLHKAMTTAPAVELVGLFSPNNASLNDVDLIGWGTELETIIGSQRPSFPPPPPPCPSAKDVVLGCPTRTYVPALRLAKHSDPRERPGRTPCEHAQPYFHNTNVTQQIPRAFSP